MTKRSLILIAGCLLLLAAGAFAQAAPIRLRVTAELANIRLKPSISSIIVRQIPEGSILEATRKDGEFYLVKLEPDDAGVRAGYVHESLVLALNDSTPAGKIPRVVERIEPPKPKPAEDLPARKTEPPVETRTNPTVTTRTPSREPIIPAGAPDPARMSLTFTLGGSYSTIGDLNSGAQGLADYKAFQLGTAADLAAGEVHYAFQFGAEVLFPIAPKFFLSAGLEYYSASKMTLISYAQGVNNDTLQVTPDFQAIPVKVGVVFYPVDFLYFKVGAMYTFAKADYSYRFDQGPFFQEWIGSATGGGFGVFGAIGLEYSASRIFSVLLEVSSQYSSISGLSGTGTFQDPSLTEPVSETGKLYAYDGQAAAQTSFPLVFIRSKLPTEGGVANAREAALDLSGFAVKAGFKIKF